MKKKMIEPIKNPHSKVGQVKKKTKQEEKDELIEKTKQMAKENYGVTLSSILLFLTFCIEEVNKQEVHADNGCHEWLRLECNVFLLMSSSRRRTISSWRNRSPRSPRELNC